ncbi:MAG: hypothetical protein AAFP26_10325, partial [Planctomycetota bacterium]
MKKVFKRCRGGWDYKAGESRFLESSFQHEYQAKTKKIDSQITDRSDEEGFLPGGCDPRYEFPCSGGDFALPSRCIPRSKINDGARDCDDGSDERVDAVTCRDVTEFRCSAPGDGSGTRHRCIERQLVNDGYPDCGAGEDEAVPAFRCSDDEFSCDDGRRCVPRVWVGNGVQDCADGSDETASTDRGIACRPDELACLDGTRCLPREYACDGVRNCRDASDEVEACGDAPTMARCKESAVDRNFFPLSALFGDEISRELQDQCRDGYELQGRRELVVGFKCHIFLSGTLVLLTSAAPAKRRRVVPQSYLRYNLSVCLNGDDVCHDARGAFNCSRCLGDGSIISPAQLCDGVIDCGDLSDECGCQAGKSPAAPLCRAVYGANASVTLREVCDGVDQSGVDEEFCDTEAIDFSLASSGGAEVVLCVADDGRAVGTRHMCDGVLDCAASKLDECSAECFKRLYGTAVRDWVGIRRYLDLCFGSAFTLGYAYEPFRGMYLRYRTVPAAGGDYERLSKDEGCENIVHMINDLLVLFAPGTQEGCKSKANSYDDLDFLCELDEVGCSWLHTCELDRRQKIDLDHVCDHVDDCVNGSDEMRCPETHFYCAAGRPRHVPIALQNDGKSDCGDRSDECTETAFSSVEEMIKSAPLRAYAWISAALIVLSNSAVLRKHVERLRGIKSRFSAAYCNTFALVNLAATDVIFGVNLLVISVKSAQFSGDYCRHD